MVAAKAKNPNCMYLWMDHMMSAEANGQATVWFGEAPTSKQACDYAETLSAGHCEQTHANDEAYYKKVWYWSTPQADCADADSATTCVNQDALDRSLTKPAARLGAHRVHGIVSEPPGPTGEPPGR
jgi:putative spermidine/putrescine transport system substrate-binding protein